MKSKCIEFTPDKKTSGTKEWADCTINCVNGCYNDCKYCYAKMMANRFGRSTNKTWKHMKVRNHAVEKNYGKYSGRIMFPSSHDLFDFPNIQNACFIVLKKLLKNDNQILVTTKPRKSVIKKIDDLFSRYKENIQFRFTITSNDDKLLKFWEPNAPNFQQRLDSLIFAFNEGYKTSVSIEPFLDYDPMPLVSELTPYVSESIWVGKMNYISRSNLKDDEKIFYLSVRKNYETAHLWELYSKLKENRLIRFKDSIRIQLGL